MNPVRVGHRAFHTIDICYKAIYLIQHGFTTAADSLISFQRRYDESALSKYVSDVISENNIQTSIPFILCRGDILYTIMTQFLDHETVNSFSDFFDRYQSTFSDATTFIVPEHGKDHILTSGLNIGYIERAVIHPRIEESVPGQQIKGDLPLTIVRYCNGNDLYSKMLKRLVNSRIHDEGPAAAAEPAFTLQSLLQANALPILPFPKTAALVSDSMFKAASSVEGGSIFYKGGATSKRLAELLIANQVILQEYRFVILCFGTNDAMNVAPYDWEECLEEMVDYLSTLVDHPDGITVIINSGIGSNKWHEVPDYTWWMRMRLRQDLLDRHVTNFHFVDWSQPGPDNPFIDNDRNPSVHYMYNDHPNGKGLKVMMKRWIEICPELAYVGLRCCNLPTPGESWGYEAGQLSMPVNQ